MRAVAVLTVLVAVVAVGAVSLSGAFAASHRVAAVLQEATSETWSPDGKQIGFTEVPFSEAACGCGHHVQSRIVRASSRGGRAIHTLLAEKGKYINSVLWASGGRMLFSTGPYLYSVGVHGGTPKRLVSRGCRARSNCQMSAFMLSPNRKIAAVWTCDCGDPHLGGGLDLVRMKPGRRPVQVTQVLTNTEHFLGFSPNSGQLVFSGPSGLMALPVGGDNAVPLTQSGLPGASLVPGDAQQVQWSPDGNWVAYVAGNDTGDTQRLEVVPATGASAPRELATCSEGDVFPFADLRFSWSHTSTLLAYACTSATSRGGQFMTVRPDGTHHTNLLRGRTLTYDVYGPNAGGPQWSPDGSRLVFQASERGPVDHVWTIRANGHDLTRVG